MLWNSLAHIVVLAKSDLIDKLGVVLLEVLQAGRGACLVLSVDATEPAGTV